MTDATSTVSRLHQCLVEALHARGPEALERPVTVAEIYQDLVPYRAVRTVLAVELNADYEHALLRLLAGEGNYARLEPTTARDELRRELASPDPYVGLYRNFAACDVWLSPGTGVKPAPASVPAPGAGAGPSAATPPPAGMSPGVAPAGAPAGAPAAVAAANAAPGRQPAPAAAGAPAAGTAPRAPAPAAAPPAAAPARPVARTRPCVYCGAGLPAGRTILYCPFCGKDQRQRPCAKCGEMLQQGWRFCAACGTPVTASKPAT